MKFNPHDYQQYAINFIETHPIAAVLLDMGMGKTAITLMAVEYLMYEQFEIYKVLVVCPLRVTRTWKDEMEKWEQFSGTRYSIVTGTSAQRKKALAADADIYIINRENVPWLIEKSGCPFMFDMVVIDELSSFKNHQTARHKALMRVRPKVRRIVGLTGTPASQGLMDLFAEFKLLDMGQRLGRFIGQYRLNYFKPDKVNGPIVYSYKLLPGAEEQIYDKISDITISMKAVDYLDMPELISTEYPVYLDEKEMEKYESLKKDLILSTTEHEVTAANAASLVNKLSQMANGAVYTDDEDIITFHDKKLDALEDIVESANGKPILVAYWFKHDYTRIVERLNKIGVKYMKIDSDESITKWNNKEIPVALIHPASAGHGLNLQQGGNTMVWFGITWSLELYQQCVCRLYRQGQTEGTVTVIHLITQKTVDEKIMKWKFQRDVSIAGCDSEKCELVTPILTYADMETLQELIRQLRHAGAKSDATRGCGIHIHIGAKGHTPQTMRNLANIMASHEDLIAKALDLDHYRLDRYCRTVDPRFLEQINKKKPKTMSALADLWYGSQGCIYGRSQHYNDSRYHMLNYHATFTKGTIEFRLFQFDAPADGKQNGLHAGQLKAYIQLCLALSQMAKEVRTASPKPQQNENPKYAMRTWLLRLGFIGDEFKTARDILTKRLDGDTAFRTARA